MKLGILETGRVNPALVDEFGPYPEMFAGLYGAIDPQCTYEIVPVVDGVLPGSPTNCDAWLITGSKHGVYDDLPWIAPLKGFLRAARAARVPLIGICFGHQIMAEAFGGRAEKSAKGWGCGVHRYEVLSRPGWATGLAESFTMHAMHQDQVTVAAPDATCLASSPFCEFAMLAYGDPEAPDAISVQAHPEFGADYARRLIELRAAATLPSDVAEAALVSFGAPVDGGAFARWSLAYVNRARARRAAA